ncbi:hypothetical protein HN51_062219 [Arachis hypogaea]|uniref:Pectinesterase inhibitor domain-containing protein n=1 Tax=Arachis hypogaea TaxID=3818 RepID=A0A445ARM8_ARAHY|nr:putative invertase inhibitor [Arachis ipaensis]XP_025627525.1 putative invertase inhibitor [Arachis hypogaea]QHO19641.1 Putative invertase inhibitor [Arachis hypogaea]RYR29098.1 hypothetical protein Ahy_B01g053401 isoform A [Arachis hypogaea]
MKSSTSSSSGLVINFLLILIFIIQFSNGSNYINLISKSCKEASETDPDFSYGFCVNSLIEAISKNHSSPQPNSIEDLVVIVIKLTKSNGTNIISKISRLLRNKNYLVDPYVRACLKDCFDLYHDSLYSLEDAAAAFRSKDFYTAITKLSAASDDPTTCEDQFKEKKGVSSPLTKDNQVYYQLNIIALAFTQMCNHHV